MPFDTLKQLLIYKAVRCHDLTSFPYESDLAKNKAKRLSRAPEVSIFSTLTCPEILLQFPSK